MDPTAATSGEGPREGDSTVLHKMLVLIAVLGLMVPAAGTAQEVSRESARGVVIGKIGLQREDLFGASIRWDKRQLKLAKAKALSLSLVASDGKEGVPVFVRPVPGSAKRPTRDYVLSLNPIQKAIVAKASVLGVVASQKIDLDGGLYDRAWVATAGSLPVYPSVRSSRCSPLQPGGTYSGCYYGYTDLSNLDVHGATFTDSQFPFTTLRGSNFSGANLSYAQLGYANLTNANLSNANLTGAYLYGANMSGAKILGTILTNAQYCNTIMPNGSTNNSNC